MQIIVLQILHSSLIRVVLIAGVLFLQYHLWFSDAGFSHHRRLATQIQGVESDNHRVQEDNRKLQVALEDLQSKDGLLLVNNAREGLGMVGPDETLYRVISD